MLTGEYIAIGVFALIAMAFPVITFLLSRLLRPTKPEPDKYLTYECGLIPFGDARKPYDVQYYLFALLFVVFDVEAVVLFPWAEIFKSFSNIALLLVEGIIFIVVLALGLIYAWKEKALEWR